MDTAVFCCCYCGIPILVTVLVLQVIRVLVPKEEAVFTHQYTAEDCPGRPCGEGCDHRGLPPKETE